MLTGAKAKTGGLWQVLCGTRGKRRCFQKPLLRHLCEEVCAWGREREQCEKSFRAY